MTEHQTGIQWTHVPDYIGATWNPTVGCTRVSPGCDHCYAFALHDQRYAANRDAAAKAGHRIKYAPTGRSGPGAPQAAREAGAKLPFPQQYDVPFSTVQLLDEKRLTAPLRARRPHAYFVDSMADLFHEDVPDEFLDRVFSVMASSPQHIFMVLTKRPERMREYLRRTEQLPRGEHVAWPPPNVWLGVSAEDQQRADERIPLLLDTPAVVRFVSAEPLLGPVDLHGRSREQVAAGLCIVCGRVEADHISIDVRRIWPHDYRTHGLDWVIIGGESGRHARPMDLAWARSIVEQCQAADVPVFVKQLGARPVEREAGVVVWPERPLRHSHGANPEEWPEELRVREWPAVRDELHRITAPHD